MGNEMKPLSNDLREKFVHAVLIEGMTCRAAGERFAVSHSAVIKIVRQFVETDAIDPQKVGGSRKPALVKCYDMVRAIVDETRLCCMEAAKCRRLPEPAFIWRGSGDVVINPGRHLG